MNSITVHPAGGGNNQKIRIYSKKQKKIIKTLKIQNFIESLPILMDDFVRNI